MAALTLEERTSRLEGSYDHLATKADLERLRVDMERNRAELQANMERLRADMARWLLQLGVAMISAASVIAGIVVAIIKLT